MGEREGRALPAGELEQLRVEAHGGIELVQAQEHCNRNDVPLPALVTEKEAAGEGALNELPRPVRRFAGTRELRRNQHHQETAPKTVLGRSVGNPREPFASHLVQAGVEPRPHDQLGLEPLRESRIAGIETLDRSLDALCSFEQIDVFGKVRIGKRERNFCGGRLSSHELVRLPKVAERTGHAGAKLGGAELEQDVRPLVRVRRLQQRALEIRPGDVGCALVACLPRGVA